jgi:hypothetical protein
MRRRAALPSEYNAKQKRAPAKKASGAPEALAVCHGDTANRSRRSQPHMTVMGDKQASVRSSVNMDYLLLGRIESRPPGAWQSALMDAVGQFTIDSRYRILAKVRAAAPAVGSL